MAFLSASISHVCKNPQQVRKSVAHSKTSASQRSPDSLRRASYCNHVWLLLVPYLGIVSLKKMIFRSTEHFQLLSLAQELVRTISPLL